MKKAIRHCGYNTPVFHFEMYDEGIKDGIIFAVCALSANKVDYIICDIKEETFSVGFIGSFTDKEVGAFVRDLKATKDLEQYFGRCKFFSVERYSHNEVQSCFLC